MKFSSAIKIEINDEDLGSISFEVIFNGKTYGKSCRKIDAQAILSEIIGLHIKESNIEAFEKKLEEIVQQSDLYTTFPNNAIAAPVTTKF